MKDIKEQKPIAIFNLIITEGEKKGEVYTILNSPFRIGRMPDNDIVFEDKTVSRYHCEIVKKDNAFIIKDLNSHNGILVNTVKIDSKSLKIGDMIKIGANILLFDGEKANIFSEEDTTQFTTIKSASEILKNIREEKPSDSSIERFEKNTSILNALYDMTGGILRQSEIGNILKLTADIIIKNIGAERVYILLKDEGSGALNPVYIKDSHANSGRNDKLLISKTLINKVINEEISILLADAQRDSRFVESKSIFLYGIHSAMCVPLIGAESVNGTIYIDILNANRRFMQHELDLLTTIGNIAAISIEEATLKHKIQKEREVRQRLMRYHSPQVVEEIIKDKGMDEVNERMITVVFVDIKNFTQISEKIGPINTAALLNEYFDIITDVVFSYNGSIDKFIGDAAMAIFGVPFHPVDSIKKAVMAAVEIHKEIKKLNKYEIRIGINTGPAVIGNIGSTKRMEYTAIGDTVNIASRLESMADPGKIYIGETTYEQIKNIFNTRPVGTVKVRGKINEVTVYEVLM